MFFFNVSTDEAQTLVINLLTLFYSFPPFGAVDSLDHAKHLWDAKAKVLLSFT